MVFGKMTTITDPQEVVDLLREWIQENRPPEEWRWDREVDFIGDAYDRFEEALIALDGCIQN